MEVRSGLKIAARRGLTTAVFIGMIGVGEVIYSKYNLKNANEALKIQVQLEEQMWLRQQKQQNPGILLAISYNLEYQNIPSLPMAELKSLQMKLAKLGGGNLH